MSEVVDASIKEIPKPELLIKRIDGGFEVSSPYVELSSSADPLNFLVTLEKAVTDVSDNMLIENIVMDSEGEKLGAMIEEARKLKSIPERERPRKLAQLLRSKVSYAYDDVIKILAEERPDLASWITKNTGMSSSGSEQIKLSEIVDAGYGVCRHLSALLLKLAKEAGMEGAFATSVFSAYVPESYLARNVVKKDGTPVFKSFGVGDIINTGHAFVELRTSDGEWIPVDPSTQVVGDNQEDLDIFKKVNLRAFPESVNIDGFPSNVSIMGNQDLMFLSGEGRHTGVISVNALMLERPVIWEDDKIIQGGDSENWPKQWVYKGPLVFSIISRETSSGMNVAVVDVKSKD